MSIIKVENLKKRYGKGDSAVEALKECYFSINKGEFVAVIGPSGSGKSTLLHLLGGLDRPSGGTVYIDGQNIFTLPENDLAVFRRKKIGFIFQYYNLIPILTAEENIIMPVLLDKSNIDQSYIDDLMITLGIEERRHHVPGAMSGGQQQRVAVARALVNKPSIILADEPTGNLDRKSGFELLKLLKESIKKYNQTLVMITHDTEIASTADRIIRIEDGVVQADRVVV